MSEGSAGMSHPAVRELIDRFLSAVDSAAPGLIEGLYLTGSVALDDYRHGSSDVDFVAVTSRGLDADDLTVLATVHKGLPEAPHFDGVYLDPASLAAMPDDAPVAPHSLHNEFHTNRSCFELNPVLWLTLAHRGVTLRGPAAGELGLRADPQRLREWNLGNLNSYWQSEAAWIRAATADRGADAEAGPDGAAWILLGPARLHYTLATGGVTSKSGAGRYAMRHFPAYADLISRGIAWRDGDSGVRFVTADALAAAELTETIIEDAWRRWG
jgi:hypothetical protein